MAITSSAVWEYRSTGSSTNGGFWKTGASGVDYSQQNSAQYALTELTSSGSGAIVLTATAAADMVGNGIQIISGTNFTAGFYEIISVSAGVSFTVDRNCTTGIGAAGVANIGGALNTANGATDGAPFAAVVAGNTVHVKAGTYTFGAGAPTSGGNAGTAALPIKVIGYTTTRGDNPSTWANMPRFNMQTNYFLTAAFWQVTGIDFYSTGSNGVGLEDRGILGPRVRVVNSYQNPAAVAVYASAGAMVIGCEISCYSGIGIQPGATSVLVQGCYIHHCITGITSASTSASVTIANCIFASCTTAAITFSATSSAPKNIIGCTFYGAASKLGVGINVTSAGVIYSITNNNFYGLTTAISFPSSILQALIHYNNFYNCTNDVTNGTKGEGNIALDPSFTGVAEYTGTGATSSGSTLTDSGAAFTNVVDGRDYLYVVSATGTATGPFRISSHTATTVTAELTLNTGSNAVYKIIYGHDYTPGTNLKAKGDPGSYPAYGSSVSYLDIGAVQRQEIGGGSGGGGDSGRSPSLGVPHMS